MKNYNLGKLQKIEDLRTVWPNEARDFTVWLSKEENLKLLSDAVGIDMVYQDRESRVGDFNVDLYAKDEKNEIKIVIENQLEMSNHDHLGKIITYASGKEASVIIWIVKKARDEHRKAIEWLNQHTDEEIAFFLIEIQLWQIDESNLAPSFYLVESPNNWAKMMKTSDTLTGAKKIQYEFWQLFNEYAFQKDEMKREFRMHKAAPHHWYFLNIGSSLYKIELTASTQNKKLSAGIAICEDDDLYNKFLSKKKEIEDYLDISLSWHTSQKRSSFTANYFCDLENEQNNWNDYIDWLCDMSIKLKAIANKYGK